MVKFIQIAGQNFSRAKLLGGLKPILNGGSYRPSNSKKIQLANYAIRSFSGAAKNPNESDAQVPKSKSLIDRLWGKESNLASDSFNSRWLMAIPAFATHVCIGSPYAWSIMADIVTREYGFVMPAAADWTLMESALPLSIVFGLHGLSASILGTWQVKVGPRLSMALAAVAFGGGLGVGALGIHLHSLPLIYLGYGVLGGFGIGLGYTPPVQALIQWFPDKKGIASAIAIAGFGSGSLLFAPLVQHLAKTYAKLPEYLGPAENFVTKVVDGKLFAESNGVFVEVVQAGASELAKIPYTLSEGLYVVGTGSTGGAEALATMGLAYFGVMAVSSLLMKTPSAVYSKNMAELIAAKNATSSTPVAPVRDLDLSEVMRMPQFYFLGATFFCTATGGMGLLSVAKPMMSEVFSTVLPTIVTSAFAAKFVLMLSAGNLGGRLFWAYLSDTIGRRKTFMMFTAGSIPVYLAMPVLVNNVVTTGSELQLYAFCGASMLALSGMGAIFAILPAYEADLFGTKAVAAVHGRMLAFSSVAAVFGPTMLIKLRSMSEEKAIGQLLTNISPEKFEATFGAPMERAYDLLATKTLSISKLLAISPTGTIDPTPFLYDNTMYTLSAMMAAGFVAQSLVRPTNAPLINVTGRPVNTPSPDSNPTHQQSEDLAGDRKIKKL